MTIWFSACARCPIACAGGAAARARRPRPPAILLFAGHGTSPNDVAALERILRDRRLSYATVDSARLNAMNESELRASRLLIVPGGNFVDMGNGLEQATSARVRHAVRRGSTISESAPGRSLPDTPRTTASTSRPVCSSPSTPRKREASAKPRFSSPRAPGTARARGARSRVLGPIPEGLRGGGLRDGVESHDHVTVFLEYGTGRHGSIRRAFVIRGDTSVVSRGGSGAGCSPAMC